MLKIAIQKSGRLSEKSLSLLSQSGIKFSNGNRKLKAQAHNFNLEILFLRDDDIPQYVADGVAHLGILGSNVVGEKKKTVIEKMKLGFSKCRLSMAVPRDSKYENVGFFNGKKIATSYPRLVADFLKKENLRAEIEEISGSVEIAPNIGLADAICDIVSTGSTLQQNGLKEVHTIHKSEAVLIQSPQVNAKLQSLIDKLTFRFQGVLKAKEYKYILLNAPNSAVDEISQLLPGMKSPTLLPLANDGWSSMHSVVREDEFWEKVDKIKALGAEGILVSPIEKMVL